jgi:hypothetical protein
MPKLGGLLRRADCFAEPVIGRTFAQPVGPQRRLGVELASSCREAVIPGCALLARARMLCSLHAGRRRAVRLMAEDLLIFRAPIDSRAARVWNIVWLRWGPNMNKPVIQFLTIWVFGFLVVWASPAGASSLFEFVAYGYVASAVETAVTGPPKSDPLVVGENFNAIVEIQTGVSNPLGYAAVGVAIPPPPYVYFSPGQSSGGASYFGNATFNGSSGSLPGGFSFTYVNGSPSSDILTAQFSVAGVNIIDDSGTLTLTLQPTEVFGGVSPVPLPPTLPLFGCAVLALGLFAYPWKKLRQKVAA